MADLSAIVATFVLSTYAYHFITGAATNSSIESVLIGLIAGSAFVGCVAVQKGYSVRALFDFKHQAMIAAQCWLMAIFSLGWIAFLTQTTSVFSRGSFTISFVLGFAMLLAVRGSFFALVRHRMADARLAIRRVFLIHVGASPDYAWAQRELAERGIHVVNGFHLPSDRLQRGGYAGALKSAGETALATLARSLYDEIYVMFPWSETRALDELRASLALVPVPVFLCADAATSRLMSGNAIDTGHMKAYEIQRAPLSRWDRGLKRALDIAVAGTAVLALAPLLLFVGAAVVAETGRPIIFRQTRKGFGGHPFKILKFRSMTVCEDGTVVKQAERNDMRVTRIGKVIRRTSIDELPQLLNVLRGDMSLVGPRPHAVAHDTFYDRVIASYALRHHVKPGITGWAQVNGSRGETREIHDMEERLRLDLWYINNWSIWLDIRIIFKTAWTFLAHRAY